MPRKGPASRRDLMPDPVYRSVVVTQVVNKVLQRGKRSIAEKIVYDALADMEKKSGGDPVAVLKRGSRTSGPHWKCAAGASVVPPTRCPSRCGRGARPRSRCGGSSGTRGSVVRRPWRSGSRTSCWTRAMGWGRRSSGRTTFRRWRSRTRHSPTTGGDAFDSGLLPAQVFTRGGPRRARRSPRAAAVERP